MCGWYSSVSWCLSEKYNFVNSFFLSPLSSLSFLFFFFFIMSEMSLFHDFCVCGRGQGGDSFDVLNETIKTESE